MISKTYYVTIWWTEFDYEQICEVLPAAVSMHSLLMLNAGVERSPNSQTGIRLEMWRLKK